MQILFSNTCILVKYCLVSFIYYLWNTKTAAVEDRSTEDQFSFEFSLWFEIMFLFFLNWSFSAHRLISKSQLVSSLCVFKYISPWDCIDWNVHVLNVVVFPFVFIHTVFDLQCQCLFKPVDVSNPEVLWWIRALFKHPLSPSHSLFSLLFFFYW